MDRELKKVDLTVLKEVQRRLYSDANNSTYLKKLDIEIPMSDVFVTYDAPRYSDKKLVIDVDGHEINVDDELTPQTFATNNIVFTYNNPKIARFVSISTKYGVRIDNNIESVRGLPFDIFRSIYEDARLINKWWNSLQTTNLEEMNKEFLLCH